MRTTRADRSGGNGLPLKRRKKPPDRDGGLWSQYTGQSPGGVEVGLSTTAQSSTALAIRSAQNLMLVPSHCDPDSMPSFFACDNCSWRLVESAWMRCQLRSPTALAAAESGSPGTAVVQTPDERSQPQGGSCSQRHHGLSTLKVSLLSGLN